MSLLQCPGENRRCCRRRLHRFRHLRSPGPSEMDTESEEHNIHEGGNEGIRGDWCSFEGKGSGWWGKDLPSICLKH